MTTTLRLWTAALLCVLPFGFVWSGGVTPGTVIYGDCTYSDNEYCVPDQYVPGSAYHSLVSQAPIRVFLVAAALDLHRMRHSRAHAPHPPPGPPRLRRASSWPRSSRRRTAPRASSCAWPAPWRWCFRGSCDFGVLANRNPAR